MTRSDAVVNLRGIAVPAFGPSLVAGIGTGATWPVIALGARSLGATVGLAALAVATTSVAELFFAIPAGSVVARLGERRALLWACLVDVITAVGAWLAPSLPVYLAALFASGFTGSIFLVARQAYLVQAVAVDRRARAMSTLGGVHRVGALIGPFTGAVVVDRWGPRSAFAVAALAGLAAAAVVAFSQDITADHEAADRARNARRPTGEVLWSHRRVFATLGIGVLAIGGSRAARVSLIPLWAEQLGLSASQTSVVFGVAMAVEVALFYPAGSVMDRYGRVYAAVPCVTLMGVAMLLLPTTHTVHAVAAVTALAAVGNGIGSGIIMTLGADNAPSDGRAQFLGGWRFLSVVGASGGPALAGLLATVAGLATASLTLGGLALAGAVWLGVWVPAYEPRMARDA